MLDIAKCKDLDDWLTGSGVLAETAESKETANFGVKNKQNSLVQPKAQLNDDVDDIDSEKDEQEWMFRTFDKSKVNQVHESQKQLNSFNDQIVGQGTAYSKFQDFMRELNLK